VISGYIQNMASSILVGSEKDGGGGVKIKGSIAMQDD